MPATKPTSAATAVEKSSDVRLPVAPRVPKFAVPASQRLGAFDALATVAPAVVPVAALARLATFIDPDVNRETASLRKGTGLCPFVPASGSAGAVAYVELRNVFSVAGVLLSARPFALSCGNDFAATPLRKSSGPRPDVGALAPPPVRCRDSMRL